MQRGLVSSESNPIMIPIGVNWKAIWKPVWAAVWKPASAPVIGTVFYTGQWTRRVLATKPAAASQRFMFDFISQLASTEYLVSATTAISVYSGQDPGVSLAAVGAASLTRTQAAQQLVGGVAGCTYLVTCSGLTQTNKSTFLPGFLVVL